MVIFSLKYKLDACRAPKLSRVTLQLTWEKHLTAQCDKFLMVLGTCRRTFGSTWALSPRSILWLYRAVLVHRLAYAALVWWPRAELAGARAALEKLRGQVEPLYLTSVEMAATAAHRLNAYGQWTQGTRHTRLPGGVGLLPEFSIKTDMMTPLYFFGRSYGVVIPTREEWKARRDSLPGTGDVWFRVLLPKEWRGNLLFPGARNIELDARDRIIPICSDSQAALRALMAHRTTSRLVWECKVVATNLKLIGQDILNPESVS
ncbi:hypothetical protein TSAR_008126 [Trichomalopsis sarcophagae]|uniref:Uncharacterized protein n=1 Tax=Trichomalopsis sarcophagae TaxID=543379 RepID=A0A232EJV4_9HYME|nr:hypothetical protein TSAR_008126 [Trichomalopsis sarcophagae]